MDFIYLFRILLKRKWFIVIAGVLAGATAWFFTRDQPKYYRSRSQISTGFTISDEIKVNDANFSFFEADTKFTNAIVTFTSPSVISLLSYKLILHDLQTDRPFSTLSDQEKQTTLYKEVKKEDAIKLFSTKLEQMTVLNSFLPEEKKMLEFLRLYKYDYSSITKLLSVYRLDRTDYIQIDFMSKNPELSAYVVNTIFQEFLRYYGNIRRGKSAESIDTLKSLMEKKRQELDAKNNLLRGEGLVDPGLQSSSKLDLISNLEQTLTDEKTKLIGLYSSLRKVNQKIAASPGSGTKAKNFNENDELLILRNQMNEAYKDYLNSGSTDKTLLTKYNNLKTQYQRKYAESAMPEDNGTMETKAQKALIDEKNDLIIDIEASNTTISTIQSKISSLKGTVISDASKGATIETMMKEADLANKEYLDAKQRYTDAVDNASSTINNFRQVLVGQPAIDPEPSKRKILIGLGAVSASVATAFIIALLAFLDSSIKTPSIFSKLVNLKLISMVNFMNLKNKNLADIFSSIESADDIEKKRHNVFRESIRKLRYEIEKSGMKKILFTSTSKGQGKTTLIQALSYSMSLSKKKILILDTNFCNNDLTIQLDANPVLEKIDYSSGSSSFLKDVKKVSYDAGDGAVYVIGSVGGDYTPSEILPKEHLLLHLDELTKQYDYIFLEGPPLNDFSDSKELAKYADGVVAVFSATHSIKQIDKESIAFFNELNGKFIGTILNKVDLENVNVT